MSIVTAPSNNNINNPVTNPNNNNNNIKSSNSNTGSSSSQSSNSRCNLIVNYLPQSLKEHDFCQLFAKIGPLKTCKLMYDKQTSKIFLNKQKKT
jgi:hypothetical protein